MHGECLGATYESDVTRAVRKQQKKDYLRVFLSEFSRVERAHTGTSLHKNVSVLVKKTILSVFNLECGDRRSSRGQTFKAILGRVVCIRGERR